MTTVLETFLKTAPEQLIDAYKTRKISNGRLILKSLLCDLQMKTTWATLARHIKSDRQWLDVWSAIAHAKNQSNKTSKFRKQRSIEVDEFRTLAKKFSILAMKIKGGPLDGLAYELFPEDVLAALNMENLHNIDQLQRSAIAHRLLPCWPSASELLNGLERCSLALATNAMIKPRADERNTGNIAARAFIWHLGPDFNSIFGNNMPGPLRQITNVIFNNEDGFSKDFVRNALNGI